MPAAGTTAENAPEILPPDGRGDLQVCGRVGERKADMAERELRRMSRAELVEIIYALKQSEDQLKAENAALKAQLEDRTIRLEKAGSIAQAAMELNHVFEAAQAAADDYVRAVRTEAGDTAGAQKEAREILEQARAEAQQLLEQAHAEADALRAAARQTPGHWAVFSSESTALPEENEDSK